MHECPICLDDKEHIGILPCKHIVCLECIALLYKNSFNECPMCRAPIHWAKTDIILPPPPLPPIANENILVDFSMVLRESNERQLRIQRQNDEKDVANAACILTSAVFIIIFFFIIIR